MNFGRRFSVGQEERAECAGNNIVLHPAFAAIQKKLADIRREIRERLTVFSQRYREGNELLDSILREYASMRGEFETYEQAERSGNTAIETMKSTILGELWEYAEVRAAINPLHERQARIHKDRTRLKKQFKQYAFN